MSPTKSFRNIEEIDKQNFDIVVEGMHKCGELGLLMMDAPEEYGGLELDKASSMLVAEKYRAQWLVFRGLCGSYRYRDAAADLLRHP